MKIGSVNGGENLLSAYNEEDEGKIKRKLCSFYAMKKEASAVKGEDERSSLVDVCGSAQHSNDHSH
jgi:hypothetical protein